MEKIEPKDIRIGDYIYLVDKKRKNIRYILKKTPKKKKNTPLFKYWVLKNKSEKSYLFDPEYGGIEAMMRDTNFKYYIIYKLNKKEVLKFIKILILLNLNDL